jgi:hypothetical protein
VLGHEVVENDNGETLVRILGANLTNGVTPEVHLGGQPVEVLEATPRHVLVRPPKDQSSGQVEVFTRGQRVTGFFNLGDKDEPGAPSGALR